jgi:hypothetical protein
MSDCHRPASFWVSGLTERIGSLRPMLTGPFMVAVVGATGPSHAGRALIHAMRKNACAETSCGQDGQEVQQFRRIAQLMGHLIGQKFHHLSGLTRVSRKGIEIITFCDLGHTILLSTRFR